MRPSPGPPVISSPCALTWPERESLLEDISAEELSSTYSAVYNKSDPACTQTVRCVDTP